MNESTQTVDGVYTDTLARTQPLVQNQDRSGQWFVIAAAVLWGTTGTAQAFAPAGTSSLSVGAVRLVLGGTALLLLAWRRGGLRGQPPWPFAPVAVGAVAIAAYQLLFFAGVARTGVAAGTLVGIGSAPIIAGLLGILLLRQRPSGRWLAATALALAGCTLLIAGAGDVTLDAFGLLLAVGAGACYALYTFSGKRLLRTHSADAVTGILFGGGAFLILPLLFWADLRWLALPSGFVVALHLGLVATTLSYLLYMRGLKTTPASSAVTLALAEPLTAAFLGVVVLGERLPPLAWLGIAGLFGGLALLTVRRRPSSQQLD